MTNRPISTLREGCSYHLSYLPQFAWAGHQVKSKVPQVPISSDTLSWPPLWGDKLPSFPDFLAVKYQAQERTIT
jgi:hypothetical protein